jgi:hypothetical protein
LRKGWFLWIRRITLLLYQGLRFMDNVSVLVTILRRSFYDLFAMMP